MRPLLVVGCLLASVLSAVAQDRVLGLLTLPEVFGNGACDRFSPREVRLHAMPGGAAVGLVHVVRNWTFQGNGGCEGLEVAVRMQGAAEERPLPTQEYEYEAPAAIVLEQRGRWFRLRLATGSAWALASDQDVFRSLEKLYQNALTYLTPDWSRQVSAAPGARGRAARIPAGMAEPSVQVISSQRSGGQLWFQIEVMSHSGCEDIIKEPKAIDRGWVPAHSPSGQPSIWFFSRGC